MPYYGSTYRKQYGTYTRYRKKYYNRSNTATEERPDMILQSLGSQLGYEKARMDRQTFLKQNNYVFSSFVFQEAQARLRQLMARAGDFLKLGRALDGFEDLAVLGLYYHQPGGAGAEVEPHVALLNAKYNVTSLGSINRIRIHAALLQEIYGEAYNAYMSKLQSMEAIRTWTRVAQDMPELSIQDDPSRLGATDFTQAMGDMNPMGTLPNKWISTAESLIPAVINPVDVAEPAAKR